MGAPCPSNATVRGPSRNRPSGPYVDYFPVAAAAPGIEI